MVREPQVSKRHVNPEKITIRTSDQGEDKVCGRGLEDCGRVETKTVVGNWSRFEARIRDSGWRGISIIIYIISSRHV